MKPLQSILSRTTTKLNINVLGAGIAGLSSAKRLKEHFPAANVTVIAESFLANTTTYGAAGVWGPYKLGDSPDEEIDALSSQTHEYLLGVCFSKHASAAGVSLVTGQMLFRAPEPDPFWRNTVLGFCRTRPRDLSHYPPQYVDGYSYTTVICEGRRYLPWMMADLRASGVAVVQARVGGLGELATAGEQWPAPDLVVNCCGNAAAQLVNDDKAYPIRGQIAKVKAPWVRHFLFADPYYIIPNQDCVVLGGTSQVRAESPPCAPRAAAAGLWPALQERGIAQRPCAGVSAAVGGRICQRSPPARFMSSQACNGVC
jgi:glycine/D-amino acid oxidase-like deaminating enzyme